MADLSFAYPCLIITHHDRVSSRKFLGRGGWVGGGRGDQRRTLQKNNIHFGGAGRNTRKLAIQGCLYTRSKVILDNHMYIASYVAFILQFLFFVCSIQLQCLFGIDLHTSCYSSLVTGDDSDLYVPGIQSRPDWAKASESIDFVDSFLRLVFSVQCNLM